MQTSMDRGTQEAQPAVVVSRRFAVAGVAVLAAGCLVLLAGSLLVLLRGSGRGLDPTDEATYLLATRPPHPGAAFNGLFGYYTGLLLDAVGGDLAWFRAAGVLVLGLAFAGAGHALGRLVTGPSTHESRWVDRGLRLLLALGAASAGLLYYSLFLRTPSYNWLALLGAAVAVHGVVRAVLGEVRGRAGWISAALLATGTFLAVWGKATAGVLLLLTTAVVVVTAVPVPVRGRVLFLLRTGAVGSVLVVLHLVFVLGPSDSISAYRRAARVVAAVDPEYYEVRGALVHFLEQTADAPGQVLRAVGWWGLLLLLPFVALLLPRARRAGGARVLAAAGAAVMGAALLAAGTWHGGSVGYGPSALAGLAVLLVALCGWAVAAVLDRSAPTAARSRGPVAVAALLVVAAGAYAFGSNNGFVPQLTGAVGCVVLAAAVLVGGQPEERTAGASLRTAGPWAAAVVAVLLCATAPFVLWQARSVPYRIAPLVQNTVGIDLGPFGDHIAVDARTAGAYDMVETRARQAGWRDGTPLLDLSFTPAMALVLDADVPMSLFPLVGGFPTGTSSALTNLSYQDQRWREEAWLLVDETTASVDVPEVLASFGRTLDEDYELVVSVPRPTGGTMALYRPLPG